MPQEQITSLEQLDSIIANQEGDTLVLPSDFSGQITSLDDLDNLIANKSIGQTFSEPKSFSFEEILKSPLKGLASSAEMYARNIRVAAKASGIGIDAANKIVNLTKELRYSDNPDADFISRNIASGIESSIQSLAGGAPGAIIGALKGGSAGTAVAPGAGSAVGAVAGGALGFATSAGVLFSIAEYDRFMEELRDTLAKNNATEEEIKAAESEFFDEAIISAISEGGFEFASDLVQAKIFNLLGGSTLKESLKQPFRQWASKFLRSYFVEAASELATSVVQVETREAAGIPTQSFSEQFKDVLATTAVQSLLFSGGAAYSTREHVKKQVEKADEIFTKHKDTIDKLYNGEDVNITPETEDDIFNAYLVIKESGVNRSKIVKDGINKYAKKQTESLTKDIENIRKQILSNEVDNIDILNVDLTEKITRLKKLGAVLSNSDYGLLQNALANISEGKFSKEITEIESQIETEIDEPFISKEEQEREIVDQQQELARQAIEDQQREIEQQGLSQEELAIAGITEQEQLENIEEVLPTDINSLFPNSFSEQDIANEIQKELLEEQKRQVTPDIEPETINPADIDQNDDKRIKQSSGAAKLYPTYNDYKKDIIALGLENEIMSEKEFFEDREKQINEFVEVPAIPLVKKLLNQGFEPYASNVYGFGQKGVWYFNRKGEDKFAPLISDAKSDQSPISKEIQKDFLESSNESTQVNIPPKKESIPENKIITEEAKNQALERIKNRNKNRLQSGIDPADMKDILIVAGYYAEKGIRKSADIINNLAKDLGEWIRNHSDEIINQLKSSGRYQIQTEEKDKAIPVVKIISGGQTGADQAGLLAAERLGIETGGTAPSNFYTEKGSNFQLRDRYGLVAKGDLKSRTIDNIKNSDGTVLFGDANSAGSKFTANQARLNNKPILLNPSADQLRDWVIKNNIKILNVAGNRESKNKNVFNQTGTAIVEAFKAKEAKSVQEDVQESLSSNRLTKQQSLDFFNNPGNDVLAQVQENNKVETETFENNQIETNTNDETYINNQESDQYDYRVDQNSVIDNAAKLANYITETNKNFFENEIRKSVYKKLGSKTKRNNVVIEKVFQLNGVEYAKSIGGVFSLRLNNSNKHFGNPFSSVPSEINKGLIATKSTKESVEKYIEWILSDDTNIKPEQHKWIRALLKSGALKNKPIVYYKELGEPSHATALDYLINEYDWTNPFVSEIVNDSRNLDLKAFEAKYNKYANKAPVKGWNLKKVYAFSKDYYKRTNRVLFKFDSKGNVELLGNDKIVGLPDMPSEWEHLSVFDRIAQNRKWNYVWSVGSFIQRKDNKLDKMSDYKLSIGSKTNPVIDRMNAMWDAGQYILVMRSAQGKSEVWVKNLFPEITDRQKAREATVKAVYEEIGMSKDGKIITDANALKRSQIVMNTGPFVRYSKITGRKAKARVIAENSFGYYDPKTKETKRFANREEAVKDALKNNLRESNVKNKHDGAIYVTPEYLNTYLSELGLETKNKGGVKTFIWQKTPDGTVAGKGYFFVAKPGTFEYEQLKKNNVDILIYEDASKLGYPLNKNVEISDSAIVFTLEEPVLHPKQTFTRSQLPMMPVQVQSFYNPMLNNFVNSISNVTRNFLNLDKGGINEFMKKALGFTRSETQNDFKRMLNAGAQLHPAILGSNKVNTPLKQSYVNYIRDKVLKMPRDGFHAGFRPSDVDLNKGEIKISKQAFEMLKEKGVKLGDKLMITRSPAVRADNVIIAKLVGTHDNGNYIEMNEVEYAVFSTGDFDGDHGAVIVPEDFEIKFFETVQGIVGDITLDQYKEGIERKQESVLNEQDMADMVVRNAAGKDLIGSIANVYTIYHILVHNKVSLNFSYTGQFLGFSKPNEIKFINDKIVRFVPKGINRYDYLEQHLPISHYHLAATDQAKEDALFTISQKRTGTTRENVANNSEQVPLSSLLMELFDIHVSGEGTINDYESKRKYIGALYTGKNNPFNLIRGLLGSFGDDPNTGNSWVYEDFIDNINKYVEIAKENSLGNTQTEKLLMNIADRAFDFGFAEIEGSPENVRMVESHNETMKELEKIYNNKTVKDYGKVKRTAILAINAWSDKGSTYTEAAAKANKIVEDANLDQKQKDALGMTVFNRQGYQKLAETKVSIVSKNFLEQYFKIYNKIHASKFESLKNMSLEERTGKKQQALPETYKYKPCYKNG